MANQGDPTDAYNIGPTRPAASGRCRPHFTKSTELNRFQPRHSYGARPASPPVMSAPRWDGQLDEAVVRRAQSGDHEAFGRIVDESIDRLFAVATLMTRDSTLAEDAVQDALVRAWRDLPRLRDPSKCAAWLARLTVNATYDA